MPSAETAAGRAGRRVRGYKDLYAPLARTAVAVKTRLQPAGQYLYIAAFGVNIRFCRWWFARGD